MARCPRCGHCIDEDTGVCFECGYRKRDKFHSCPECGEPMVRGVCYRCGYRSRGGKKGKAMKTCPHCGQKVVRGYCQACDYKKSETLKWFIIMVILGVAVYLFMKDKGAF